MATMLFGVPPAVDESTLLSACADLEIIDQVAIERSVSEGRTLRWVVLFGDDAEHARPVLVALTKAAGQLVVVVADDDTWRVFALAHEGGQLAYRFDDVGDLLRQRRPQLTVHQCVVERTSEADAADVNAGDVEKLGTAAWRYFKRAGGAGSPFEEWQPSSDDFHDWTYALFWPDLYDWDVSDGDPGMVEADEPVSARGPGFPLTDWEKRLLRSKSGPGAAPGRVVRFTTPASDRFAAVLKAKMAAASAQATDASENGSSTPDPSGEREP